jgi:glucosamine--fructose-6-phosphate aminotransferase (isomerizing)
MGGIFGFVCNSERSLSDVLTGLRRLTYRGYDGVGIAFVKGGSLKVIKQVGHVDKFKPPEIASSIAIGHTRYASRGWPTYENTHPLMDCKGEIAVVLDGIVDNYEEYRASLTSRGHRFVSTTDVEIIPHMLEERTFEQVIKDLKGIYSLVAVGPGWVKAAQMGQPLILGKAQECTFISSDIPSLYGFAEEALIVPDNTVIELGSTGFRASSVESRAEVQMQSKRVKPFQPSEKAGFPHFMLKEIYEVPEALIRTMASLMEKYLRLAAMIVFGAKDLYIVGNGTSLHAGMISSYYFAESGIPVTVTSAAEFPYYALENVGTGVVIIAVSQSGETSDIIRSVKLAKQRGAVIVGVTNNVGSRLALESNVYLPVTAGPEMAVPATKTFTSTILTLLELATYAGLNSGKKGESDLRTLREEVRELSKGLSLAMPELEKSAESLVSSLNSENFYVTSSGINFPISLEGALKMKEAAGVHAEGVQTGELLHGPLVLSSKGYPIIFLKPVEEQAEELYLKAVRTARERGARVATVSFDQESSVKCVKTVKQLSPISYAVPMQMIAYKLGVMRNMPIDTPVGLVKAVIY